MPGHYQGRDYDLAGFAVGAVERGEILPRPDITIGDVIVGLPSSGVHSNGYSLVRRLAAEEGLGWDAPAPFAPRQTLADALLTPTRIYVKPVLAALEASGGAMDGPIKALSHITGGGLSENLPRVLPPTVSATIDLTSWQPPAVFGWLAKAGRLSDAEMLRTFNCGIGMVAVVAKDGADGAGASHAGVGRVTRHHWRESPHPAARRARPRAKARPGPPALRACSSGA